MSDDTTISMQGLPFIFWHKMSKCQVGLHSMSVIRILKTLKHIVKNLLMFIKTKIWIKM